PSTSTSRASARSSARRATSSRPFAAWATGSMSRDWWTPDAPRGPLGVAAAGEARARSRLAFALRDQLRADDRDVARGLDAEADLTPLQPDDGHADVVADVQLLHKLPRQDQHG